MTSRTRQPGAATPDLPAIHAAIRPLDALLDARRTLYQVAARMLVTDHPGPLPHDVVDNPCVRGVLGRSLATGKAVSGLALPSVDELADVTSGAPPLVARPEANTALGDALASIGSQLARQSATAAALRLLTEADGSRFAEVLPTVSAGIELARSVSPALLDDLLPHIALLGIAAPDGAARLSSASSRTYPGLVVLGVPESELEVAEGLVHEGAHQKFFDLAITGAVLTSRSDQAPAFVPSWGQAGRQWPMEQTMAAGHAYACLAQFAADLGPRLSEVGPESVLPAALERSELIGTWLLDHDSYLGPDALTLVRGWLGRRPPVVPTPVTDPSGTEPPGSTSWRWVVPYGLVVQPCSADRRAVVGLPGSPAQIFFVQADAGALIESLAGLTQQEALDLFRRRMDLATAEAAGRAFVLARELEHVGLLLRTSES